MTLSQQTYKPNTKLGNSPGKVFNTVFPVFNFSLVRTNFRTVKFPFLYAGSYPKRFFAKFAGSSTALDTSFFYSIGSKVLMTLGTLPVYIPFIFRKHFINVSSFVLSVRKEFKVFNSIICLYSIYMMDDIFFGKYAAYLFSHIISMFVYVSFTIRHWISFFKNLNISISISGLTSIPVFVITPEMHGWIISHILPKYSNLSITYQL